MAKLFSGLEGGSIEGRKIVGTWLESVGPNSGILPHNCQAAVLWRQVTIISTHCLYPCL